MLIAVLLAVLLGPPALLGAEVLLARRGPSIDAPDVATLTARHTPEDSRGEIRFLWLGDSTAAAVGTTDPRFAVSTDVGESVSASCRVTVQTRVIAKSGATVADVLRDQLPVARDLGTDVAIVVVGANDVAHLTSKSRFETRYRRLVEGLIDTGVRPENIVLVGVPDMGSPPRLPRPLRNIAGWRSRGLDERVYKVSTQLGTRYVDLFAGTSAPFRRHPTRYFARDNYHPSDSGYAVWARAIAPVVARTCS